MKTRTLSRSTSTKTVRTARRTVVTETVVLDVKKDKLLPYLHSIVLHWNRVCAANYEAGVATLQSRLAAAKASVIRDVIESVETEDYLLEEWIEDD